jgi:CDP-diacylglycerol---serine O-phosphatidyltransferase
MRILRPIRGLPTVRRIAVIPTLLTLGNAVCGFAAIAYASKTNPQELESYHLFVAGWLIIAAMVFDSLDGAVARLSKTSSKFGGELDSLCDGISFGAAPAFLLLRMGPHQEMPLLHQVVAVIATLYMVCAVLRLARFNVEAAPDQPGAKRFRGLPSPGAAGCLASLAILRYNVGHRWPEFDARWLDPALQYCAPLGALAVALLMVSRLPYPHLTKQILRGRRQFSHLIQVILGAFVLWLIQDIAPFLVFWTYALGIPAVVWVGGWSRASAVRPEGVPPSNPDIPHQA